MKSQANRRILVEKLAETLDLTHKQADALVKVFLDSIETCITNNEGLALKGFGTFKLRVRKGRAYKHPLTGESVDIPNRTTVTFKAAPSYLARLRSLGIPESGGSSSAPAGKPSVGMVSRPNSG